MYSGAVKVTRKAIHVVPNTNAIRVHIRAKIADEIPSTLNSSNDGWLATYQSSMIVVGLFVGVEVPLLFFLKSDSNFQRSGNAAKQALLALAYGGLFFSFSAAFSGLILTTQLRKIPAQTPKVSSDRQTPRGCVLTWHWVLSLIGSMILPVAQVLLYVWLEESNTIIITLSIVTLFALFPLVFLLLPSDNRDGKRQSVVST